MLAFEDPNVFDVEADGRINREIGGGGGKYEEYDPDKCEVRLEFCEKP